MERIYDIGANVGAFTKANLAKFPNANFVLIEANPTLCASMTDTFSNNNNVKIINRCVSDTDNSNIDFYLSTSNTLSTASVDWVNKSRFTKMNSYQDKISVPSITLDTLIVENGEASYIKIDVEGYEYTVIKGMTKNLGLLSFEWAEESKSDIEKSINHLHNIGYTQFHVMETDNYTSIPTNFVDFNTTMSFIDCNLIPTRMDKWGMIFAK